jgi:hypothetical protein
VQWPALFPHGVLADLGGPRRSEPPLGVMGIAVRATLAGLVFYRWAAVESVALRSQRVYE